MKKTTVYSLSLATVSERDSFWKQLVLASFSFLKQVEQNSIQLHKSHRQIFYHLQIKTKLRFIVFFICGQN